MYLGMYRFHGDPTELEAAHDRLLTMLPPGQLELHLCVRTDDGLAILDSCPSRQVFEQFSTGAIFRSMVKSAGLPEPVVQPIGEVRSYVLPAPKDPGLGDGAPEGAPGEGPNGGPRTDR